jgi:hypothetical protein
MFWPNEFWLFDKIWRFCNIKLAKLEQQLIVFKRFFCVVSLGIVLAVV